jgi:exportin-2 (importin alpha re-exporter)
MCLHYEFITKLSTSLTAPVPIAVRATLQEHAADPAKGWRAKDCAVYLVMAVTVRGKTGELGATSTNRLVNISDFFTQQVQPQLLG